MKAGGQNLERLGRTRHVIIAMKEISRGKREIQLSITFFGKLWLENSRRNPA